MTGKRSKKATKPKVAAVDPVRLAPQRDDVHDIVFFKRHRSDDPAEPAPGRDFLNRCPPKVRAQLRAVLTAVAAAPPHKFAGGGYWEAMHGDMTGWFEIRADGPQRHHYRLFCRIDMEAKGADKPHLVIVTGLDKPFRTTLSDQDYTSVRALGDEYFSRSPRSTT